MTKNEAQQVEEANVIEPKKGEETLDFTSSSEELLTDDDETDVMAYLGDGRKGVRRHRILAWMIGIATLVGAGVGIFFLVDSSDIPPKNRASAVHPNFLGIVNASTLALHDTKHDCWLLLHGSVYDLTHYARIHPGGPEWITDWCGEDGSQAYAIEHPESLLARTVPQTRVGFFQEETVVAPEDISSTSTTTVGVGSGTSSSAAPGDSATTTTPSTTTSSTFPPECLVQAYDVTEIRLHNSEDDCWMVLYNQVYDMTDYLDDHPGGATPMIPSCGLDDATALYMAEKKHDQDLLVKKNMVRFLIGRVGPQTGLVPRRRMFDSCQ